MIERLPRPLRDGHRSEVDGASGTLRVYRGSRLKLRTRSKEGAAVASKTTRARVRAGHIEPLEPLPLREWQEVRVTLELIEDIAEPARAPVSFAVWDLGALQPLTRADIYDDIG
jgi:hypothetical protein